MAWPASSMPNCWAWRSKTSCQKARCLCLDQVASGASENPLLFACRSLYEGHDGWRCPGGDAGRACLSLWLLSASPARLGTLRAAPVGVLGGFRDAKAAGSSPAPSKPCLVLCCCGAGGAATLEIAAQPKGGAGAGAAGRSAWTSTATGAASVASAGCPMRHARSEI